MIQRLRAAATSSDSLPLIVFGAVPTSDLREGRVFFAAIRRRQAVEISPLDRLARLSAGSSGGGCG